MTHNLTHTGKCPERFREHRAGSLPLPWTYTGTSPTKWNRRAPAAWTATSRTF